VIIHVPGQLNETDTKKDQGMSELKEEDQAVNHDIRRNFKVITKDNRSKIKTKI